MNIILNLPHLQFKHHLPFPVQDVIRLNGEGNYTVFTLADGSQFTSSRTLGIYESALPKCFLRIHKNCMINAVFVKNLNPSERTAILTDGSQVVISRRRWNEINELFIA